MKGRMGVNNKEGGRGGTTSADRGVNVLTFTAGGPDDPMGSEASFQSDSRDLQSTTIDSEEEELKEL